MDFAIFFLPSGKLNHSQRGQDHVKYLVSQPLNLDNMTLLMAMPYVHQRSL